LQGPGHPLLWEKVALLDPGLGPGTREPVASVANSPTGTSHREGLFFGV